jgi:hypothetical protein
MAKKEKNVIERKFMSIKTKYKAGGYDIVEMDGLTCDLIAHLAQLTQNGVTEVEGVPIDLYKDRTFWLIEKLGLLPEYRDEDIEFDGDEIKDNYYSDEDDDVEVEIDDSKFYQ